MRDPYAILGVSPQSDLDEIRSVYHRRAKLYHPDLNHEPDAEDHMRDINWAYQALAGSFRQENAETSAWTYPETRQAAPTPPPRPITLRHFLIVLLTGLLIVLPALWLVWTATAAVPNPRAPAATPLPAYMTAATRTAEALVLDDPNLVCSAWTNKVILPAWPGGCFYGPLWKFETLQNDPEGWHNALWLGEDDAALRVLLSNPAKVVVMNMQPGDCLQVRGMVEKDRSGVAEIRVIRMNRIKACP